MLIDRNQCFYKVFLRTVDNFQGEFRIFYRIPNLTVLIGEEADIVLLSLVRNPGEGRQGSIGFLKVMIFHSSSSTR